MDGYLPKKAQRLQDSAAELGPRFQDYSVNPSDQTTIARPFRNLTAVSEGDYGFETLTRYHQGAIGFTPYATNIGNSSQPPLDAFNSLKGPNTGYEHGNQTFQNVVHRFGSPNAIYDGGPRYPLNDLHGHNAAQTAGFGGEPANQYLYAFGTTVAPSIVYGGGNNSAHDAFNGDFSPSDCLTARLGDYGQGNYASEGVTYSGLYPVNDIGATGAVYGQADSTALATYAGNVDHSLHNVDNIHAPNAVHNQDNYAGMDPYAGNVDHEFLSVDSMAIPSAICHESVNARYNSNAANIHDGLLRIDDLAAPNTAHHGASTGPQNACFSTQISGPTFAIDSTLPPLTTSDSGADPRGRRRTTGVDHRGRPRWTCDRCDKTFGRSSDMQRHAQKHSGVLQYQCNVAGCAYPGSYRQDKLEQHRRNCH